MNGKQAKRLRRAAEELTVGTRASYTRVLYRRFKRLYKLHHGNAEKMKEVLMGA